jgi:hypothetical protein
MIDVTSIRNNNFKNKILEYLPVFYVYIFSLLISLNIVFFYDLALRSLVLYFLGFFSLTFGVLKFYDLKTYVQNVLEYDLIAQNFKPYAYIFPFFEVIFGILFILQKEILFLEYFCIALFLTNIAIIANALEKKKNFRCACMGGVFKLPLSYVSLLESLTMVLGSVYLIYKM